MNRKAKRIRYEYKNINTILFIIARKEGWEKDGPLFYDCNGEATLPMRRRVRNWN